jgi:hypothetical protein
MALLRSSERRRGKRKHIEAQGHLLFHTQPSTQPMTDIPRAFVSIACGSDRVNEEIRNFKYHKILKLTDEYFPWARTVRNIPTDAWPHDDVWTGTIPPTDDEADAMMTELGDDEGETRYSAQDWSNHITTNDKAMQYIQYTKSQLYKKDKFTQTEYEEFQCSKAFQKLLNKAPKRYIEYKRHRLHEKYTAYQEKTYTTQGWPAWLKEADDNAEYQRYRASMMYNTNINTRFKYESYRRSSQFQVDMNEEHASYLDHKRRNEHKKYTNYQKLLERCPQQMTEKQR